MLDSSGSINQANFMRVLNFIRELASRLDVEGGSARISVMTFADDVRLVSTYIVMTSDPFSDFHNKRRRLDMMDIN